MTKLTQDQIKDILSHIEDNRTGYCIFEDVRHHSSDPNNETEFSDTNYIEYDVLEEIISWAEVDDVQIESLKTMWKYDYQEKRYFAIDDITKEIKGWGE